MFNVLNTHEFKFNATYVKNKKGQKIRFLGYKISLCDIKKVIFQDPATIVFWEDGTKTVVKANGEDYDPEKGLALAIAKKAYGNKGSYYNIIKKWLSKTETQK